MKLFISFSGECGQFLRLSWSITFTIGRICSFLRSLALPAVLLRTKSIGRYQNEHGEKEKEKVIPDVQLRAGHGIVARLIWSIPNRWLRDVLPAGSIDSAPATT